MISKNTKLSEIFTLVVPLNRADSPLLPRSSAKWLIADADRIC
jgi:hypothetical protein